MSDESLPVLLNTVQTRLISAQRQLGIVRAQVQAKHREAKLHELTYEQLKPLGDSTRMYKAVGKMFMQQDFGDALAAEQRKLHSTNEDIDALKKKETSHLNDLVHSIEKAQLAS
ncbi:hypothetical protein MVES_002148 [Malassezia vespertilionis]|uniref:Prefoldin subunit 1 n=1 Tax=Malassezia vespertilionis TaxID=2020962 RepID=A0A2N1JCE0_9BASI|nr:hypothetical protein MVES_002148 [Malassezia vespertilionis]